MIRIVLAVIVTVTMGISALSGALARPPAPSVILSDLGFRLGEQLSIDEGEVISRGLPRARDNELAAVAAMMIPAPVEQVEAALLGSRGARWHEMPADPRHWSAADFGPGQQLMPENANSRDLNLSADEAATLQAGPSPSAAYRDILIKRMHAYADHGMAGIAPYARAGGATTSPQAELHGAAERSRAFLAEYFPTFADALMREPDATPASIENRFSWTRTTVEGRPAVVLAHEMVDRNGSHTVVSHREFFVGHTYNSLHGITVLVPATDGTLAVRVKRTFTDRVGGPFNSFQREIGQKMVQEALVEELTALRQRATGR